MEIWQLAGGFAVGCVTSYVAIRLAIRETQIDIQYMKRDLESIKKELGSREEGGIRGWIHEASKTHRDFDHRISNLEEKRAPRR